MRVGDRYLARTVWPGRWGKGRKITIVKVCFSGGTCGMAHFFHEPDSLLDFHLSTKDLMDDFTLLDEPDKIDKQKELLLAGF